MPELDFVDGVAGYLKLRALRKAIPKMQTCEPFRGRKWPSSGTDKRSSCIPPSSAYHRLLDNCEIVRKSLKIAGEPYKPDSVGLQQVGVLTIIPLGCNSHCSSSSLPEGCSRQWPACLTQDVPFSRERRKLSFALLDEPGRLSPPIWPCTTRGFPCLVCCQTSGGLLLHRFTLTSKSAFERR